MRARWLLAGAVLALGSCAKTEAPPAPPPYDTKLSVLELMEHVVDPAAKGFWAGSGTIITAAGEVDRSPTTPEGWAAVENAAAAVAESGNLLLLPGRARDDKEWRQYSLQLIAAGKAAMLAAEAKDKNAVFDTGGKIYEVCTACHEKYLPPPPE
jgi:hypothetical protein